MQLNRCTTWNRSNQAIQSKLPEYTNLADQQNHEPPDDFSEFQGENEPQSLAGTNEGNDTMLLFSLSCNYKSYSVIT